MVTLPEADDQVTHTLIRSLVSFGGEFSIDACHVVTALGPPLTDEREGRIELTGLFAPFAFGKGSRLYPTLDRAVAYSHPLGNGLMAQPLLPQCHRLLVASYPLCPMKLHDLLLEWRQTWGSLDLQRRMSFEKLLRLQLAIGSQLGRKTALQRLAEIFEQMPFVCDLDGLWSCEPGGGCIRITAIPTNDFN